MGGSRRTGLAALLGLLALLLAMPRTSCADDGIVCAMLTLDGGGVLSGHETEVLTTAIMSDLSTRRCFTFVDRERTKELLTEQAFAAKSDSVASAVEAGRIMAAELVLHGRVRRVGDGLTLSLAVVDVATGAIRWSVQPEVVYSKDTVWREGVADVVRALVAQACPDVRIETRTDDLDLAEGVRLGLVWIPAAKVWLGRTEVTMAQYESFLKASAYDGRKDADAGYLRHKLGKDDTPHGPEYPAVWISYRNAQAFCSWLSERTGRAVRLPTETEWQSASCGDCEFLYPWGNDASHADRFAWYAGNASSLQRVAQRQPNAHGIHDMSGNAWEFCAGQFSRQVDSPPVRGGSWFGDISYLKVTSREPYKPTRTWKNVGFRIAVNEP